MKNLQLSRPSDEAEIRAIMENAYGKIENSLDLEGIRAEAVKISAKFPNEILDGGELTIEANESLKYSYKYAKDTGTARLRHNGRVWIFVSAGRGKCFAGNRTGGSVLTISNDKKEEVLDLLCRQKNIVFSTPAIPTETKTTLIV